jgi:hypothetical protein
MFAAETHSDLDDNCSHCHRPLEIVAVNFRFFGPNTALFVCRGCGLVKREARDEARRKLRRRIIVLETLLTKLHRS